MTPYNYFTGISPGGGSPQPEAPKEKIKQAVNKVRQQPPVEPKVVYIDKPYPVEVPKQVQVGNPNNNYKIPWGLITILGIVGIVSVSIVAIVIGGKK